MMRDKQCDGRVQMLEFVAIGRIDRNEAIAVQHRALVNALRERLSESRLPNSEWSVQYNDHTGLLCCSCEMICIRTRLSLWLRLLNGRLHPSVVCRGARRAAP